MTKRGWTTGSAYALPVYLFLAIAVVYPLAKVLARGVSPEALSVFSDRYLWERLLWSLEYGLAASSLVILLGVPLAYSLRYRFPGREAFLAVAGVPFVMPTIVVATGFLTLLGPRGIVGRDLTGTVFVLLWAAVFYNLGLATRILHGLLARQGEALEAAARTLGASPLRAFFRVTLPLLKSGLWASGGLTFVYTFASFGVPLLLGGYRYATLEVEVYRLLAYELDFPRASALVVWQSAVLALVSLAYLRAQSKLAPSLGEPPVRTLSPRAAWLLAGLVWGGTLVLYSPLLALIARSFFGPEGLGLDNYLRLLRPQSSYFSPGLIEATGNTLRFGLASLALALPVGLLYALGVARKSPGLDLFGFFPLLVSPVSLGIGYLLAYPHLRASTWILVLAYATLAYPLLGRTLIPALRGLKPEFLEAAATLGAGAWRRFWRVELPLIRPALAGGMALALASAIGEFGATMILVRPEWATLTVAIYDRLGKPGMANFGEALALSVILMGLSLFLFALVGREGKLG